MNGWEPRTRLGKMVKRGEITTLDDALATRLPLRESEIIDALFPNLQDDVLDVNMVQRMTDSGRRVKFTVTSVVGNGDGYVGLGKFKGKEVGPTIRKSLDIAKLNMVRIRRGCGSWQCGCGNPHTIPFKVEGKAGSVTVQLMPAPSGIGLAAGDTAKSIFKRAGIEDIWAFSKGQTRTTINFAMAVFNALEKTAEMRVRNEQADDLNIIEGYSSKKDESQIDISGGKQKKPEKQAKKEEEVEEPQEEKEKPEKKKKGKKKKSKKKAKEEKPVKKKKSKKKAKEEKPEKGEKPVEEDKEEEESG